MSADRSPASPASLAVLLAASALILAGCATTTSSLPPETIETTDSSSPARTQQEADTEPPQQADLVATEELPEMSARPLSTPPRTAAVDPAAAPVVALLASQLRIPSESITVQQVDRADWPDTCLGLPAEGEICGMMITSGWAITLSTGDQRYQFRTDESGQRIRLASAPLVDAGKTLVTWRDSRSFSMLVVGTQRVAFGRRGRPMLAAPLAIPARAGELETLLARYSAFQANTPAGQIEFAGVGTQRATPTEQRMIAEWARLVHTEADKGLSEPAADRAIVWRRQGSAGGADTGTVVIGRAGFAVAHGPTGPTVVHLEPDEMQELYRWIDRYESFEWRSDDEAPQSRPVVSIDFAGEGVDILSETDRDAMLAFIHRTVRRLLVATVPE
jgi:hypothetical protein